jgi:hypothetical protein
MALEVVGPAALSITDGPPIRYYKNHVRDSQITPHAEPRKLIRSIGFIISEFFSVFYLGIIFARTNYGAPVIKATSHTS